MTSNVLPFRRKTATAHDDAEDDRLSEPQWMLSSASFAICPAGPSRIIRSQRSKNISDAAESAYRDTPSSANPVDTESRSSQSRFHAAAVSIGAAYHLPHSQHSIETDRD